MFDRIAKRRLNIILLVDTSKSMQGKRISQVNEAISDIKDYLINLQAENTEVDFDMTLIPFGTEATFYKNSRSVNISDLVFQGLKASGWSNLHLAYGKLEQIMKPESKGGIMPDFGGLAPIVLLLSDGHPTKSTYKSMLNKLKKLPWFNVSLRFAIAIGLDDQRTFQVLEDFTSNKKTVLHCVNADTLKEIIKIVVVTSSKVKSEHESQIRRSEQEMNDFIIQSITDNLSQVQDAGW